MASKQLYEAFYSLLESPEHQELSAREIDNSPRDPNSYPPLGDAPGKEAAAPRSQDDDQSFQICVDLFTKFNIDPYLMGSIPGLDHSTAHLLVRSELEQILFSDKLPRRTKDQLEDRLSYYMGCGESFGSIMSREEAVATQDTLLLTGSVKFADLPKIFLIGDIVYTADRTPLKDTLFEQCWVAVDCELVTTNVQKDFIISVKRWRFDAKSDNGWYLESAKVTIYGYEGNKSIQLADIGVVPLKSLPAEEQRSLSDRMIARGRLYLEMSQIKIGCWDYDGPSCCKPHYGNQRLRKTQESSFDKLSPWMRWNSVTCERVVMNNVVSRISIASSPSIPSRVGPRSSMSKDCDKMFLICSGAIFVRTLPDFAGVSVFIDNLRPVQWRDCELKQNVSSITAGLSLPRPDHAEMEVSQCDCQANGKAVIVRTSMPFMPLTIAAMAENAKRPLVRLDLLDIIHPDEDFIQHLQQIFEYVQQIEAYLYLQNFESLVAKRLCKDRKGCVEIRRFLDLMRSFHNVIFIPLSNQDETDPLLDMMDPIELVLQGSEDASSTTKSHIFHIDGEEPTWDGADIERAGRSMRSRSSRSLLREWDRLPPLPRRTRPTIGSTLNKRR